MTSDKTIKRYGVSTAAVLEASKLVGDGTKHPEFGSAITEAMPPTFPTDYDANVDALTKAIAAQADAAGAYNLAIGRKADARIGCTRHTRTARNLAKRSLDGENELLHSAFTVGQTGPNGIKDILARAEKIHLGCTTYSEKLSAKGWPALATTNLAAAITALDAATSAANVAKQVKKGATDTMIALANSMYDLIRSVQIVADAAYPAEEAQTNAKIREARGMFLLGVFPPPRGKKPAETPDPTPAPTTPAPTAPAA